MKKNILGMILLLSSFLNMVAQTKQDFVVASVGQASEALQHIYISESEYSSDLSPAMKNIARKFSELIGDDFAYYKHKYTVDKTIKGEFTYSSGIPYSVLLKKGVDILIQTSFSQQGSKTIMNVMATKVLNKTTFYKSEVPIEISNWRTLGHSLSDRIYRGINDGKQSIFKDKIIFVSDYGSQLGKQIKELYVVDFDGEQRRQLTRHGGVVISPAVSPDGNKILYSLIDPSSKVKNINLMMLDLVTGKVTTVSDKKGINSGAVFTGDGKSVLLTLSFNGNADIYELRLDNKQLTQVTEHTAADVDPSINGKGTQMSFLSDRSGRAMIYSLDLTRPGAKPVRISYVGKFNATPRYSPDGEDIVFSSWLDERFDIFRIKNTGNQLVRLTKDFGSNEEPNFSLDNEFIIFSSKRVLSSKKSMDSIYLMTRDGEIVREIIKNFGACTTARWLR